MIANSRGYIDWTCNTVDSVMEDAADSIKKLVTEPFREALNLAIRDANDEIKDLSYRLEKTQQDLDYYRSLYEEALEQIEELKREANHA